MSDPGLIATQLSAIEAHIPCTVGKPFALLTVTRATLDPKKHYSLSKRKKLVKELSNTAQIDFTDPAACPSWDANPIPKPDACRTPSANLSTPQ